MAYDYGFLSRRDAEKTEKDPSHSCTKLIDGRESNKGVTFGHVIPRNGVLSGGHNVDLIVSDIQKLGYKRVIIKSDKEPAIVKQAMDVTKAIGVEVLAEFDHKVIHSQTPWRKEP